MEELDKEIGSKLQQLRKKKGLSLREVGERIDISHTYVSKIEKGQTPSLQTLKKLCNLYDITVSSLFGDESEVGDELKEAGVKWISFSDELNKRDLTPEETLKLLDTLKILKKL